MSVDGTALSPGEYHTTGALVFFPDLLCFVVTCPTLGKQFALRLKQDTGVTKASIFQDARLIYADASKPLTGEMDCSIIHKDTLLSSMKALMVYIQQQGSIVAVLRMPFEDAVVMEVINQKITIVDVPKQEQTAK